MKVAVQFAVEEEYPGKHAKGRKPEYHRWPFAKNEDSEERPNERADGKVGAGPCRTYPTERFDETNQTHAVTHCAD